MLHSKGTDVLDTLEAIKARARKAELHKIVSHLDPEAQRIFQQPISRSSWYCCDAFSRFLEVNIRETAVGNEQKLVQRAEAVIEKLLSGIYKMSAYGICHYGFRKALKLCCARKVHVHFTVPIEVGGKFRKLQLLWDGRKAESIAVRFGQNGPRVPVPKSKLHAGVLRCNRGKPKARAFQVLKTLQFQVPSIRIADQDVIDGILGLKNICPHDTTSTKVVRRSNKSLQSEHRE